MPHREGLPILDALESFSLESDEVDSEDNKENEDCSPEPPMLNDFDFDLESYEPYLLTQGNCMTLQGFGVPTPRIRYSCYIFYYSSEISLQLIFKFLNFVNINSNSMHSFYFYRR